MGLVCCATANWLSHLHSPVDHFLRAPTSYSSDPGSSRVSGFLSAGHGSPGSPTTYSSLGSDWSEICLLASLGSEMAFFTQPDQ